MIFEGQPKSGIWRRRRARRALVQAAYQSQISSLQEKFVLAEEKYRIVDQLFKKLPEIQERIKKLEDLLSSK